MSGYYEQKVRAVNEALINQGILPADLEELLGIQRLPGVLFDDELPLLAGTGIEDGITGILVATDRRLLFVRDFDPATERQEPVFHDPLETWGNKYGRPPHAERGYDITIGFNMIPDLMGRDRIESVYSSTGPNTGELWVTYESWELREMGGPTPFAAICVRELPGDKAKQFADFLRGQIPDDVDE